MAVEEKLAKRVQKYFGKLQKEVSNTVLLGDKEASAKEATFTLIQLLTAENNALSALGWEWAREENGDICEPAYIVPIEKAATPL